MEKYYEVEIVDTGRPKADLRWAMRKLEIIEQKDKERTLVDVGIGIAFAVIFMLLLG